MLATLLFMPGYLTSVIALATLWEPLVQGVSMKLERSFDNRGRK